MTQVVYCQNLVTRNTKHLQDKNTRSAKKDKIKLTVF